jgi:hypothetical protein
MADRMHLTVGTDRGILLTPPRWSRPCGARRPQRSMATCRVRTASPACRRM